VTGDEVLLKVADLRTRYPVRRPIGDRLARRPRQWVRAVDGVSFSLRRGEMVALVGESGCGKTTTAQTILRMVESSGGTVTVDGQDITAMSQRRLRPLRRGIQMVYQDPYESLDPRFRVHQTVAEPLLVHGIGSSRAERAALVSEALERAGLAPARLYLDRYPHELSGGQRQRVAIAAALAVDPVLLLADEPVSMLDVSVRAGVLALLDGLRRDGRLGVLMITHDLSTAAHFADRIAVMYLGRIVEYGPARSVINDPRHPYTKALLSVVPDRDPRRRRKPQILSGETPNPVAIPSGCRFRPRCPIAEAQCAEVDPQLMPAAGQGAGQSSQDVACLLA
jgi:peptide/nickel transport system ATP-binding protein